MDALDEYRKTAIAHGEATADGKSRIANRAYDKMVRIRRALRRDGLEQARILLPLLDDESIYVRLWAAVDALELSPEDGVRVLRELSEGPPSPTRGSAETLLEQWNSNTFRKSW